MTKKIPVLSYENNVAGGASSIVVVDTTIDQTWDIDLNGSDGAGNYVQPTFMIIDNTGINSTVYAYDGQVTISVSPYTRKKIGLNKGLGYVRIIITAGAIPVIFFNYDPGIPDEVNDVASGIASGGGTVTAYATLSASDTNSEIALSNGNLKASGTIVDANWRTSLTSIEKSSGKYYFEGFGEQAHSMIGVAGNTAVLNNHLASVDGCGRSDSSGQVFRNGVLITTHNSMIPPGYFGCAVDLTAELIWFRVIGTDWNNDPVADPAAGVNGISIAALTGPYRAGCSVFSNGIITMNFGASPFAGIAPAGYGSWGI
jgi:hypothetical protein